MFEKIKKMLSGGATPSPPPPSRSGGRRPARPRTPRKMGAGQPADVAMSRPSFEPVPAPTPHEIPCPNCGEPMLSGWGTTCGRCRPNLVAPKTLFLAPDQKMPTPSRANEGMALGWLVVAGSLDHGRQGSLIELDQDASTLSRGDGAQPRTPGLFEFSDIFMSHGHAIITRPRGGSRQSSFSIRDRDGVPTANGTFVNSRRLPSGESLNLADGDVIKVGATQLVFRSLWLPGTDARAS